MISSTDAVRFWWIPALAVYTVLVVIATLAASSGIGSQDDNLADKLQAVHEEEIARMQELQDRELAERDRILEEYQGEIEVIRNDYWTTINQIETEIRAQREDIVRRIYEDPDAAAQILADKYGLVYVP
jgi:hypothetical protein